MIHVILHDPRRVVDLQRAQKGILTLFTITSRNINILALIKDLSLFSTLP